MVERFNGRISEFLQQTPSTAGRSGDSLAQLPQALQPSHSTPRYRLNNANPRAQGMELRKPELFLKRIYDQTGLDI